MSLNGRKRAESHSPLLRKAAGPSKIYGLEADNFHVINARPAAGEKIEDSTDLVRPVMMCGAVQDISARVLL